MHTRFLWDTIASCKKIPEEYQQIGERKEKMFSSNVFKNLGQFFMLERFLLFGIPLSVFAAGVPGIWISHIICLMKPFCDLESLNLKIK
jgi:hypothetical protein